MREYDKNHTFVRYKRTNMMVKDIIKGLMEIDDTTNVEYQVVDDISPYVKSAQASDKLGYGKIVLIDFRRCTFPYVSPSILSKLQQNGNQKTRNFEDVLDERQLRYIRNVLKSYFALLKKPNTHVESSVLHFDLSISVSICIEMIHVSLTPCLFDANKDVILGLCMLTYSTKRQIGNALIKLSEVDYHLEMINNEWVRTNNSHLTNMEKVIIVQCVNGKSIVDMAEHLSVSTSTIKTHRTNILNKLGVNNITEAIQYVEEYNLI